MTKCTDKTSAQKDKRMQGIRDDNFYTVFGWMLNVLELKGSELTIFAIIFSFSQDGESEFKGSISYLQSFSNIESKKTVYTALKSLEEKRYIKKRPYLDGKIQRCAYKADLSSIELMKRGISELKPDNSE